MSYPRLISTAKALRFLEEKVEWVLQMREKIADRAMQGAEYTPEQIETMRREAKRVLPEMVAIIPGKWYDILLFYAFRRVFHGSCQGNQKTD